jgi:phosphoribosyl-AMP cyclohydrolase / phosphoribosyl-ATP pyrophosphohydrolase
MSEPGKDTSAVLDALRFDRDGLVAAVAQQHDTGEVLMLAWMNRDAVAETLATGWACYWSRSRRSLWRKGETSGHVQRVVELRIDCDGDAVLLLVDQTGPACHTGERSCFHRGELEPPAPHETLPALERTLVERAARRPEGSYTVALLDDPPRIGAKVMEEAEEVARAAREESDQRVDEEAADLLYHLLVLLRSRDRRLADAERILDGRRR